MSKTILVVEDEKILRDILVDYLSSKGYEVCKASTGEDALQAIEDKLPELVILDVELPDMNGIEVLKQTKAKYENIVFLVVSGNQSEHIASKAIKYGAFDYIGKPINIEDLEEKFLKQIFPV